jgi:hypothetical protein
MFILGKGEALLSFFVVLGRKMMRTSKPKMNIMEKK